MPQARRSAGFTLIELLIVVAIIAILAAIAVPNFLEAQTRSKVSRAKADMRSIATAVEAYAVDHNSYPEGTDNPANYPEQIEQFLGPLARGYYSFRTRSASGLAVGRDFHGITTPVAYMTTIPTDPFAKQAAGFLTYCYRNAKVTKNGWVMTSVGPDTDLLDPNGQGSSDATNPLSTGADANNPKRLGDVNEREVVAFIEGAPSAAPVTDVPRMREYLTRLAYDATNGTISDGDVIHVGAGLGLIN